MDQMGMGKTMEIITYIALNNILCITIWEVLMAQKNNNTTKHLPKDGKGKCPLDRFFF
jgi:hypothetical protein